MSITIKNLPYDSLTAKINPVYNGLDFVVDSSFKTLNNFKYIAEIFVENNKVGELRHNPDISNNNYGIFDVGRVVESYLSQDLNWDKNIALAPNSLKKYHVQFGEEWGRVMAIKSYSNSLSNLKITLDNIHPLQTGDAVLIQGISGAITGTTVNFFSKVIKSGTNALICPDISYQSGLDVSNAYILMGETANQWLTWTDTNGNVKVRLKVKAGSSFNIGDRIYIYQESIYNDAYQNIEWTIERKSSTSTYTYLDISCPFGTAVSSTVKGYVVSRDNAVVLNMISTQNHKARATNGVEQYDTWLTWDPRPYLLTTTTGTPFTKKYLTKRPDRTLDVCLDDYMTLSMLGKTEMTDFTYNAPIRNVVETWQDPATTVNQPILTAVSNSSYKPNLLEVTISGNWTPNIYSGDYIDITTTGGTVRARVVNDSYSAPDTHIVLDTPFDALATYTNFNLVIHAINNTYTFQNTRFDMGAGPKNLNITEINNGSAYKYFIYSVYSTGSLNFWNFTKVSETWTFNLDCSCSKFKKWTVVWLNELGGFDYYNFDRRNDKVRNIERDQFRKHLKTYSTTNGMKYKLGSRGRTTYNVKSKDTITLRTGFLNQDYIDWLQWAFESPEVYIIDNETSKIYPVNCIDQEVQLYNKTNVGDRGTLYIYEIKLEMANNRVIQRGGSYAGTATSTTATATGGGTPYVNPNNPYWNAGFNGTWQTFNYTHSLYE